jgi:UDP-N-acetylmuramate dehydrogenase
MELPQPLLSIPHKRDVPFARLTTLGIGGVCRWLFEPETEDEVQCFVKTCRVHDLPYRVLGGGSNILVMSDVTVPVMRLALPKKINITANGVMVSASQGHQALINDLADMGYSGVEWACGIPGSFGGALRMNAGANGGEWSQVVERIRFLTPDAQIIEKNPQPQDFGYRSSFLTQGYVALGASIRLVKSDTESVKKKMEAFQASRRQSQPTRRSAGCIFKNPPGKSAGQLIESAGLKGIRVGDTEVSNQHANFLLNLGNGTPENFWELINLVIAKVREVHGCELEMEVDVWKE